MKLAASIDRVTIDKIEVGIRRRKKVGNVRSLAKSIEARGLLHPILLRNGHELVSGHRRLEACRSLGWTTIPARHVDGLSDEELRAVELEENTERLDLEPYERSRERLAEMRQQQAEAKAETRTGAVQVSQPKRGPSRTPGSRRDVAKRAGISPTEQVRIERHVELAERYPFMQRSDNGWLKNTVLKAGDLLQKLPKAEHPTVATLMDQPGIPADAAVKMIGNLAAMPIERREEVYGKAKSADVHDRKTALTMAMRDAPPPDPAALLLDEALPLVRRAAKECRVPAFVDRIRAVLEEITAVLKELDAIQAEKRKAWASSAS